MVKRDFQNLLIRHAKHSAMLPHFGMLNLMLHFLKSFVPSIAFWKYKRQDLDILRSEEEKGIKKTMLLSCLNPLTSGQSKIWGYKQFNLKIHSLFRECIFRSRWFSELSDRLWNDFYSLVKQKKIMALK